MILDLVYWFHFNEIGSMELLKSEKNVISETIASKVVLYPSVNDPGIISLYFSPIAIHEIMLHISEVSTSLPATSTPESHQQGMGMA
jgi:hypothetical protein